MLGAAARCGHRSLESNIDEWNWRHGASYPFKAIFSREGGAEVQRVHAVVLGSRFGGMAVVTWLRRLYSPSTLAITVVDQWQEMVYRPGLVHAMDCDPDQLMPSLVIPLSPFWRRLHSEAIQDTIVGLDPNRRLVYMAVHDSLAYDVLFIATGSTPVWNGIDGLEFCHNGICEGYLAYRTAALNQSEFAGSFVFAAGPIKANPAWSPTIHVGCECPLLESALLWDQVLRRRGRREAVDITVISPAPHLAEDGGPIVQERLEALFAQRHIRIITNARYTKVTPRQIRLADQVVFYDRAVWIPPAGGLRWLTGSGVDDGYGWVPTDFYLRHPDWPDIYAVGDVVSHPWPKMGHSAMVQARVAVHHWAIMREKKKNTIKPYQPAFLSALETGPGQGFFVLSDAFYGGHRQTVHHGR